MAVDGIDASITTGYDFMTDSASTTTPLNPHERSTSYAADKAKIQARLRRIEGQVRGIQRMVDEDQYCIDILTQMSAIMSALRTTGMLVLDDHVRGCVVGTCRHGHENKDEMVTELMQAIERFTKNVG